MYTILKFRVMLQIVNLRLPTFSYFVVLFYFSYFF